MNTKNTETVQEKTEYSKAKALSRRLGIHPKTLARWGAAGKIARFKLNERVVLYNVAEVMALVTAAKIPAVG
jgi:predicted site-specific integrase-resolvase